MTVTTTAGVDWEQWLDRWEVQQSAYIPFREERFTAMLDALELAVGDEFTAIDLMCGPGAITRRIVKRFPRAHVIAIDLDPVLMSIGRNTIGPEIERVTWIEANLGEPGWLEFLGGRPIDAVLSTTAIHWLAAGQIVDLYRDLANLIRPGGVLLNGDQMQFAASNAVLRDVSLRYRTTFRETASAKGAESWEAWWLALRAEPALRESFEERDRRFAWRPQDRELAVGSTAPRAAERPVVHTTFPVHAAAMLDAGFSEVGAVWQHFDNRVLMAVR